MHDLAREVARDREARAGCARAYPGAGGWSRMRPISSTRLKESVESGKTLADDLLDRYYGDWNGDLSRIYADYSY